MRTTMRQVQKIGYSVGVEDGSMNYAQQMLLLMLQEMSYSVHTVQYNCSLQTF